MADAGSRHGPGAPDAHSRARAGSKRAAVEVVDLTGDSDSEEGPPPAAPAPAQRSCASPDVVDLTGFGGGKERPGGGRPSAWAPPPPQGGRPAARPPQPAHKKPRVEEQVPLETQDCPICLEAVPTALMHNMAGCPHSVCFECLRDYVTHKLEALAHPVTCPLCRTALSGAECRLVLEPREQEKLARLEAGEGGQDAARGGGYGQEGGPAWQGYGGGGQAAWQGGGGGGYVPAQVAAGAGGGYVPLQVAPGAGGGYGTIARLMGGQAGAGGGYVPLQVAPAAGGGYGTIAQLMGGQARGGGGYVPVQAAAGVGGGYVPIQAVHAAAGGGGYVPIQAAVGAGAGHRTITQLRGGQPGSAGGYGLDPFLGGTWAGGGLNLPQGGRSSFRSLARDSASRAREEGAYAALDALQAALQGAAGGAAVGPGAGRGGFGMF